MKSFQEFKKEFLKDPEHRRAYDALEMEYQLMRSIIRKRIERKLTQAALAKKMGTKQAAIARLESGEYNPSVKQLAKVAKALDAKLIVKIV